MQKKILILDKDSNTVNALSRLIVALDYEAILVYNWQVSQKNIKMDQVQAVFIDIEIPMIKVDEVVSVFLMDAKTNYNLTIPIFFLYTKRNSKYYNKWINLPHTEAIRKPIRLAELYDLLNTYLPLQQDKRLQESELIKLQEFQNFSIEFHSWLNRFGAVLES